MQSLRGWWNRTAKTEPEDKKSDAAVVQPAPVESKESVAPVKKLAPIDNPPPAAEIKKTIGKEPFLIAEFQGGTGDPDLDGLIQARISFANKAHQSWMRAVNFKFESERKAILQSHFALPWLQKYFNHLTQFKQDTWWSEWQRYILKRFFFYVYEQAEIDAFKRFEQARLTPEKEIYATLMDHIAGKYLAYISESPIVKKILGTEEVEKLCKRLQEHREHVKKSVKPALLQSAAVSEQAKNLKQREQEINALLPKFLGRIHVQRAEWRQYGFYPFLRAPLLANVAKILTPAYDELEAHLKENEAIPMLAKKAGAGLTDEQVKASIEIRDRIKSELELIADVMLLQEQVYCEQPMAKGHVDLALIFLHATHDTLSEYDEKSFSLDCKEVYWASGDADLRQTYKKMAEAEDKTNETERGSSFWCFHDALPDDVTPRGLSQFRAGFVEKFGGVATKAAMKQAVYKTSHRFSARQISNVLLADEKAQRIVKERTKKFLDDFFGFKMLSRERLLEMDKALDEKTVVSKEKGFAFLEKGVDVGDVLKRTFPSDMKKELILQAVAEELNVLKNLLLHPANEESWLALLVQAEKDQRKECDFKKFVAGLQGSMRDALEKQKEQNATRKPMSAIEQFRLIIRDWLAGKRLNAAEIKEFAGGKLPESFKSNDELVALYHIYYQPDSIDHWRTLFAFAANSEAQMKFLRKLMCYLDNQATFKECQTLYAVYYRHSTHAKLNGHLMGVAKLHARQQDAKFEVDAKQVTDEILNPVRVALTSRGKEFDTKEAQGADWRLKKMIRERLIFHLSVPPAVMMQFKKGELPDLFEGDAELVGLFNLYHHLDDMKHWKKIFEVARGNTELLDFLEKLSSRASSDKVYDQCGVLYEDNDQPSVLRKIRNRMIRECKKPAAREALHEVERAACRQVDGVEKTLIDSMRRNGC